jgi:hypothetical protein
MNLTQLETVETELQRKKIRPKQGSGGFSVKKQGFQGLTARNQGLKPKLTKEPRGLHAKY